VNDRGPFTFVVDTGAGITIVSPALAGEVRLRLLNNRSTAIAGLSGREVQARHAVIDRIALGDIGNLMPGTVETLIAPDLPSGIDGVLDPGDVYSPLGYAIDFPAGRMTALDPNRDRLSIRQPPLDGAVVPWVRDGTGKRPFVRLSDGRTALIDTGSDLGLAFSATLIGNSRQRSSRDLGGGTFGHTRVAPSIISIGSLVLREVPTDILSDTEKGAPVILGRDALYPFRISFDPLRRLIAIAPSRQDRD
jgi:hypothetical protein